MVSQQNHIKYECNCSLLEKHMNYFGDFGEFRVKNRCNIISKKRFNSHAM